MVAFAIIIRHALAIDASWGANRYANTVLGHVSLAATMVDAIVDVILGRRKVRSSQFCRRKEI